MAHIPTLSVIYYKDSDSYSYQYDDVSGNTQEEGMFPSLATALGEAAKSLPKFYYIGIEEK
jgi:hypothetical protein